MGDLLGPQMKIMTRYGVMLAGAYLAAGRLEEAEAAAARGLALATMDNARAYHVPLGASASRGTRPPGESAAK